MTRKTEEVLDEDQWKLANKAVDEMFNILQELSTNIHFPKEINKKIAELAYGEVYKCLNSSCDHIIVVLPEDAISSRFAYI